MPKKLYFGRSPLLDLLKADEDKESFEVIKEYFKSGKSQDIEKLINEQKRKWEIYLNKLINERKIRLFKTHETIPNEEKKIEKYAKDGDKCAQEILFLKNVIKDIDHIVFPPEYLIKNKKDYEEYPNSSLKDWYIWRSQEEIFFPKIIFDKKIFTYEKEYVGFPLDWAEETFGSKELFIYYKIFKDKPEVFIDNIYDVLKKRYIVKQTLSTDIYTLLFKALWEGNDKDNYNRFFTRRMKSNIYEERQDISSLGNSIGNDNEERVFEDFFLSSPRTKCNIRDPLQPIYLSRPELIEQAIYNHLIGNYSASINLLLPIIEGIIWDISVAEHKKNGGVYEDELSDLTSRDIKKRVLLNEGGKPINLRNNKIDPSRIKDLIEQTKMKDIFNRKFIKMFCQELYSEERNPILHGSELDYNISILSSKLFLVLEYLLYIIKKEGYKYPTELDPPNFWGAKKSGYRLKTLNIINIDDILDEEKDLEKKYLEKHK